MLNAETNSSMIIKLDDSCWQCCPGCWAWTISAASTKFVEFIWFIHLTQYICWLNLSTVHIGHANSERSYHQTLVNCVNIDLKKKATIWFVSQVQVWFVIEFRGCGDHLKCTLAKPQLSWWTKWAIIIFLTKNLLWQILHVNRENVLAPKWPELKLSRTCVWFSDMGDYVR